MKKSFILFVALLFSSLAFANDLTVQINGFGETEIKSGFRGNYITGINADGINRKPISNIQVFYSLFF